MFTTIELFAGAGGLAGHLKHCRRYQHHPQHRHQPALFLLRRNEPDDVVGRDGYCPIRIKR